MRHSVAHFTSVFAFCSLLAVVTGCPGPALGVDGGGEPSADAGLCTASFTYRPQNSANRVGVIGEWNAFDRTAQLMSDADGDGTFEATLRLPPGQWAYAFTENGAERVGSTAGQKRIRYHAGVAHPVITVADCHVPQITVDKSSQRLVRPAAATGQGEYHVTLTVERPDGETETPTLEATVASAGEPPRALSATQLSGTNIDLTGLADGKYTVRVRATSKKGSTSPWVLLPFWVEKEAFVFSDSPLYMVMTDRFRNGNPANDVSKPSTVPASASFQGGDFEGIEQAIREGYFDRLNVKAMWLTPWFTQPDQPNASAEGVDVTGYHGYWPIKAREIEPRWGGADALKRMITEAHRHGIRIMMDTVLNHVHEQHEYFKDSAKKAWFRTDCTCGSSNACGWDNARLTCLFAPYMPDVNWTNNDAAGQFIADVLWAIEEFDVDGLRIDATKHVEESSLINLSDAVRTRFEQAGTHYYLFGENFTNDANFVKLVIGPNALDGQLNFPLFLGEGGRGGPELTFGRDDFGLTEVKNRTSNMADIFEGALMVNFIGSHDVPRFITKADVSTRDKQGSKWGDLPGPPQSQLAYDRLNMAMVHVMTNPGVPLLYYGDEYGEHGGNDPDNRHMMLPSSALNDAQKSQVARTQKLLEARAQLRGLRRGALQNLWCNTDQWGSGSGSLYAYARPDADPKQSAVVVLNLTDNVWAGVSVEVSAAMNWSGSTVVDHLTGRRYGIMGGAVTVDVPARGASLLHLE